MLVALVVGNMAHAGDDLTYAQATSINVFGVSYHPDTVHHFNRWNLGLGYRQYVGFGPVGTTRVFMEVNYIVRNSLDRPTWDVGAGLQWSPEVLRHGVYRAGLEWKVSYMGYTIPADNPVHKLPQDVTVHHWVLMGGPFVAMGPNSIHVALLEKPRKFATFHWDKRDVVAFEAFYNYEW